MHVLQIAKLSHVKIRSKCHNTLWKLWKRLHQSLNSEQKKEKEKNKQIIDKLRCDWKLTAAAQTSLKEGFQQIQIKINIKKNNFISQQKRSPYKTMFITLNNHPCLKCVYNFDAQT